MTRLWDLGPAGDAARRRRESLRVGTVACEYLYIETSFVFWKVWMKI